MDRKKWIVLGSVVGALLVVGLTVALWPKGDDGPQPRAMSAMEVMGQLRNQMAVLIDIRDIDDVVQGSPQGALVVVSSELDAKVNDLPYGKTLIFCCDGAGREMARTWLLKDRRAAYLESFEDWKAQNLPVAKRR